jgi:CheY-like chemotaxis protein/AraC-like DNA-binding protein
LNGHRQPDPRGAVRHPAAEGSCAIEPRLLIIDDNEGALSTLAAAFREAGFHVSAATSGAAGLALALGGAPHVVVADQCLPDLTGLEVLAQLRALGSSVPVVLMSGWPTPELKARADELGSCGFLAKPTWLDELLPLVQRAVQAELPPVDPEVARRAEPVSQAMREIRQFAMQLLGNGEPSLTAARVRAVALGARPALLHELTRLVVAPNLSVRELPASAEAIRKVARAPAHTSSAELAGVVLEALSLVGLSAVRRPLHAKVVEALTHLARLESNDLPSSETGIADAVGISASRLSRLLRPQTGLDFRQWRRGFRMRQAAQQLGRLSNDVSRVAELLGCTSASQFDHEFHDLFGITPSQFRKVLSGSDAS